MARLADSTGELRPTAARVLKALRTSGPQTTDQLTATLATRGRAIRPATIQVARGELVAAALVADAGEDGQQRWLALSTAGDPLLAVVDLRGAHDFRHTFATWLEDAGIPARVIDEVTFCPGRRRASWPWRPLDIEVVIEQAMGVLVAARASASGRPASVCAGQARRERRRVADVVPKREDGKGPGAF